MKATIVLEATNLGGVRRLLGELAGGELDVEVLGSDGLAQLKEGADNARDDIKLRLTEVGYRVALESHRLTHPPLHPERLTDPLEGTLRREIDRLIAMPGGLDIMGGPEVPASLVATGTLCRQNTATGGFIPYPHGPMTKRDQLVMAETVQWLGSPFGFAFLVAALEKAGCTVTYDAYKEGREAREQHEQEDK